ncbi:MAG TPA: alkaline phosphatase D family protein [Sphingobacteriaceae bacterium]|nr:alkaline phosphatase D family protein [Sphingobacteriaceae bacterium]
MRKLVLILLIYSLPGYAQKIFFTTGFKVTEVTDKSAIIWTRLCKQEKPNPIVHSRKETVFRHPLNFDENMSLEKMDGGVKGVEGLVRITLIQGSKRINSKWYPVSEEHDFTASVIFTSLKPDNCYQILLEAKASDAASVNSIMGSFCTAPGKKTIVPVALTSSTCQYFWSYDDDMRGFKTYDSMNKLNPDFFVQTGDYVYYDKPGPLATNSAKARHKWHAMDAWPALVDFYKKTPAYFLKDDHDLLADDANPKSAPYGDLKFNDGLKIWHENVPLRDKPYRTFRWGKDLQVWMVEGREYRSTNKVPEGDRTIWGEEQKAWFKKTMKRSDATFKLVFSPTPIVGPDRENKSDNHANNAYKIEGDWIRQFLSGINNTYVVCGDRHWQYVSVDNKTGLTEFGSGPVSDAHAQGWDPADKKPQHKFLRVKGGFIGIKIDRDKSIVFIQFTHYDVDGKEVHNERFPAL